MFFWLGLPGRNFGCVDIGCWPSHAIGLLLLAVFVTHFVAFAKCQFFIISRMVGGDGRERMMLYVLESGRWVDYWDRYPRRRDGRIQLEE